MSGLNNTDSVEVNTGFGKIRAGGPLSVIIIIELACTALLIWYMGEMKREFVAAMQESAEQTESQTYVLTLSPEERAKLRLNMPRKLREQLYVDGRR